MSRPRFLADNDLKDAIVRGVRRREPAVEFVPLRNLGMEAWSDADILEFAAKDRWIIVSHDVNTMTTEAFARLTAGKPLSGLLLVHQRDPRVIGRLKGYHRWALQKIPADGVSGWVSESGIL